jgi:hypothetical protein
MKCARAKKLFGAYWDDEITQGEREWLESHLNACAVCRKEYDGLARTLEALAAMPREEPAADLLERTLASARRASTASDRLPEPERRWIPVTATAAAAVLVVTLIAPWTGWRSGGAPALLTGPGQTSDEIQEPVAVARLVDTSVPHTPGDPAERAPAAPEFVALSADSLFDHSEDVEFILDPVALRRGRAHPLPSTRTSENVQVERAVISF